MRSEKEYEKLKMARRMQGITQSDLAREVFCKQSAISMFEAGHSGILSDQTIEKIARHLGVDLTLSGASAGEEPPPPYCLALCPIDTCPSNVPYMVQGHPVFRPGMVRIPRNEASICTWCGEPLESCCPNTECGAPLCDGAFCPQCRAPYITVCLQTENMQMWIAQRQQEIETIRQLTQSSTQSHTTRTRQSGERKDGAPEPT